MNHQLLSSLELFLSDQFEHTFMPPTALIFWHSADTDREIEKYMSYLSTLPAQEIFRIYNNVYELLCTPYSVVKLAATDDPSYASFRHDENYEYYLLFSEKTLLELSNVKNLKEIFSAIFKTRRRALQQQADERKALEWLPENVRACWQQLDFSASAQFVHLENGSMSIVADFAWGQMEIQLVNPQSSPAINGEQIYMFNHKELYTLEDGFELLFRYDMQDESGSTVVSETEQSIVFSGAEYQYKLFNYYEYSVINGFPAERTNLQIASRLSHALTNKHNVLGDSSLNESEKLLLPAAHVIQHLHGHLAFFWMKSSIENMPVSSEQLNDWAQRLKTEGKCKYLQKAFTAFAKCKENTTDGNIKKAFNRLRTANLELTTIEGRYVLYWFLAQFAKACSQYMVKHENNKDLDGMIREFRRFATERLKKDEFTGVYPHFRKMMPKGKGQFISFIEISYYDPNTSVLTAMLTAGVISLDRENYVEGIPFEEITAYDSQFGGIRFDGKYNSRYCIVCGMENPAYTVNSLPPQDEKAETHEKAKINFEIHLKQVYRVLSGQRMTQEYKAKYGIKNDIGKRAWKLAKICFLMGIGWATGFWLLMSLFSSIVDREPYLTTLFDPFLIVLCYAGGLFFALIFWLLFFFLMFRMQSRK